MKFDVLDKLFLIMVLYYAAVGCVVGMGIGYLIWGVN